MCGRYTMLTDIYDLASRFGLGLDVRRWWAENARPRYNIAPSQDAVVMMRTTQTAESKLPGDESTIIIGAGGRLVLMRWGLVPSWAKDEAIGSKMINARSDTLAEKPSFMNALKHRRCLVPADGFYEWVETGGIKEPYRFTLESGEPFAFAGLWERKDRGDGPALFTFTIITKEANGFMSPYHHRMPVILPWEMHAAWLDEASADIDKPVSILQADYRLAFKMSKASRLVNSPKNDGPECLVAE